MEAADRLLARNLQSYEVAAQAIARLKARGVQPGLAVILAAANTYLGLFAGMTIASAIPAAVVSMAVLRALGGGGILENNIVQTGASAGTSIASGVIFTVPALVLMGYWPDFKYWWVLAIAGLGGTLLGPFLRVVTPLSFGLLESINYVLIVVVGGAGHLAGPLLGVASLAQLLAAALATEFWFPERAGRGQDVGLFQARYRLPPSLVSRVRGRRVAIVDDGRGIVGPGAAGALAASGGRACRCHGCRCLSVNALTRMYAISRPKTIQLVRSVATMRPPDARSATTRIRCSSTSAPASHGHSRRAVSVSVQTSRPSA